MISNSRVRWGILSTANIAKTAFIPALRQTQRGELVAVASRSQEKAEAFAQEYNIPHVFGDYASLLASPEIDAIYNPLPNTMHAEWTALAAQQGKHIFCEKPLGVTVAEAQQMVDDCQEAGVLLVEAFVFLYHPQTLKLRQLLDDGVIGELVQMQAHFTFALPRRAENIRWNQAMGGGAMNDVGCYAITFARFAFGEEPVAIQSAAHVDPEFGVDSRVGMLLTFPGNRFATLQIGFDAAGGPGVALFGTKGTIEIPQPFHPQGESHFVIRTRDGEETAHCDTGKMPFTAALEQFHDCLLDGAKPLVTADNAVATLRVMEAAMESARTGQRVEWG